MQHTMLSLSIIHFTKFPDIWVGGGAEIGHPARSPDLTYLEYYLCLIDFKLHINRTETKNVFYFYRNQTQDLKLHFYNVKLGN